MVEGQNDSFSAASKGYKRYQTMNNGLILNSTVYLSIVADHVHPFMTTVYPHLLMTTSSRIMHCVTKLKIISDWFLDHDHEFTLLQTASTVTRSQYNRASLGCGGTRDSHHGCAVDKSAATA